MRSSLLILMTMLFCAQAIAQKSFLDSRNAYLGQQLPQDTPKLFAPLMLVPDSGIALDRSAFSADGKEFYYCTALHWFDSRGAKIRYFEFKKEKWQGPYTLNEGFYAPTFSIDNNTLYFLGGPPDAKHALVWKSVRSNFGWSQPEVYLKKDYGLYDFMPTRSGTYYIASNGSKGDRKNFQTYDFSLLHFHRKDTVVESLGPSINTPSFNGDFYVAPDESYMIVSYKEKPDFECELGISFRKKDGSWGSPQNLGPFINNGDAHRWGQYVSPDGKYLFYTKGSGEKDCHLYWVRFDRLRKRLQRRLKRT